jgi:hypothetical protein
MALSQQDIEFIKSNMAQWLAEQSVARPPAVYEIELRERMVRVEEELKHQRELMREGFEQIDRRLERSDQNHQQLRHDMLARFDEIIRRHDRHFLWLIGFITTVGGLTIAAGQLL